MIGAVNVFREKPGLRSDQFRLNGRGANRTKFCLDYQPRFTPRTPPGGSHSTMRRRRSCGECGRNSEPQEFCGSWKLYWPDGTPMPHDECPMALALKHQRPIRGMEGIAERPDGTRVPFIPYPTPLFDSTGALIGAVNTLVDITDRHAAESRIRESDARHRTLAAIVESSADAILTMDLNGVITSWNRRRPAAFRLHGGGNDRQAGHAPNSDRPAQRRAGDFGPHSSRRARRALRHNSAAQGWDPY